MKIPNYERVHWEIPDPRVFDSAEQFYAGADALFNLPPGSGVSLPFLTCAAFALELYVKAMTSWSVIKNCQDYGHGVSGGTVSSEPQSKHHQLSKLLGNVPSEVQENINSLYAKGSITHNFDGIVDKVKKYDRFYVEVRYSFENQCLNNISRVDLWNTVKLLRSVVTQIDHKGFAYV